MDLLHAKLLYGINFQIEYGVVCLLVLLQLKFPPLTIYHAKLTSFCQTLNKLVTDGAWKDTTSVSAKIIFEESIFLNNNKLRSK
jgi:hypothetical protein